MKKYICNKAKVCKFIGCGHIIKHNTEDVLGYGNCDITHSHFNDCIKGSKCMPVKSEKKVWYGWAGFVDNEINDCSKLGLKYFIYKNRKQAKGCYKDVRRVRVEVVK